MTLDLYTARLGYRGPLPWLDVSLQGNLRRVDQGKKGGQDGVGLWFSPTPQLLYPYLSKRRFMRLTPNDWTAYAADYTALMRARYKDPVTRAAFDLVLRREQLVLLCFCTGAERCSGATCEDRDCDHCHRRLLADILVKAGAHQGIEVRYLGELDVAARARPALAPGDVVVGGGDGGCQSVFIQHEDPDAAPVGAIICRGRRGRKKCSACLRPRADKLCDYPLTGTKAGSTCDKPVCSKCAVQIAEDIDYCPPHARLAREGA